MPVGYVGRFLLAGQGGNVASGNRTMKIAILASGPDADNSNKAYEYIEIIVRAEMPERAVQVGYHGGWCIGADAPDSAASGSIPCRADCKYRKFGGCGLDDAHAEATVELSSINHALANYHLCQ